MFALIKCVFPFCGECLSQTPGERSWTIDQKHTVPESGYEGGIRGERNEILLTETQKEELDQSLCVAEAMEWDQNFQV